MKRLFFLFFTSFFSPILQDDRLVLSLLTFFFSVHICAPCPSLNLFTTHCGICGVFQSLFEFIRRFLGVCSILRPAEICCLVVSLGQRIHFSNWPLMIHLCTKKYCFNNQTTTCFQISSSVRTMWDVQIIEPAKLQKYDKNLFLGLDLP